MEAVKELAVALVKYTVILNLYNGDDGGLATEVLDEAFIQIMKLISWVMDNATERTREGLCVYPLHIWHRSGLSDAIEKIGHALMAFATKREKSELEDGLVLYARNLLSQCLVRVNCPRCFANSLAPFLISIHI